MSSAPRLARSMIPSAKRFMFTILSATLCCCRNPIFSSRILLFYFTLRIRRIRRIRQIRRIFPLISELCSPTCSLSSLLFMSFVPCLLSRLGQICKPNGSCCFENLSFWKLHRTAMDGAMLTDDCSAVDGDHPSVGKGFLNETDGFLVLLRLLVSGNKYSSVDY